MQVVVEFVMCSPVSCCFKKRASFVINQIQERNGVVKENGEMREKSLSVLSANEEVC